MKFKVGDKVRLKSVAGGSRLQIGAIGTIISIEGYTNHSFINANWGNGHIEGMYDNHFELATSLPINLTFKNKYEHRAMQQFLFDNGCEWWGDKGIHDYGKEDINVMANKKMYNGSTNTDECRNAPFFTFNDLDTIKEILNPSKPVTEFTLNNEYTAIIDPNTNTVKVGCQTFSFDKIKELASKL